MQSFEMEYHHPHFAYIPEHRHHMDHDPQPMLHHHHIHPHLMESYMHLPHHFDYSDFPPHGALDDYEDNPEIMSRPRLTKEQVEVLESQFQAHPKPNSNVKRQLAIQTKLTLPRVANWFQNRRAKAKQQRKQEEFEILQSIGTTTSDAKSESSQLAHPYPQSNEHDASSESRESTPNASEPSKSTAPPLTRTTSNQEASFASLQRALAAAEAARGQHFSVDDSFLPSSTLESAPQAPDYPSSTECSQFPLSTFSDWPIPASLGWNSSSHSEQEFDFGNFNNSSSTSEDYTSADSQIVFNPLSEATAKSTSDEWTNNLQTPTMGGPLLEDDFMPPAMPHPAYLDSRRGSSSDDLTAGLGNIGLNGMTSSPSTMLSPAASAFPKSEGSIDLAARRKRPRPAMLGTASLRSRSYGAPPTLSPTLHHPTSPLHHPIRHVKSTGNSLNVHFSGIRKPASAQRSPLNISTFAEAEALNAMVVPPPLECSPPTTQRQSHVLSHSPLSPEERPQVPQAIPEERHPLPSEYFLPPNMSLNPASPPATPLRTEYLLHLQQQNSLVPPMSAPPQFATWPDYTPPYSAGPLTTGSWSDAPLASPEHNSFGQPLSMPQPTYISPMIHEVNSVTNFSLPFTSPPDLKVEPNRSTDFFIQEFPQQKENHALAAHHLSQQKPKNYVFANATATDFVE